MSEQFDMIRPKDYSRRTFIKQSSAMLTGFPIAAGSDLSNVLLDTMEQETKLNASQNSIIGQYGPWAASLKEDPPKLSFRQAKWKKRKKWHKKAMKKVMAHLGKPMIQFSPTVTIERTYQYDGLDIEELSWALPYGRPTKAILLKPQGATKPLPAILGLHDHGGNKYFGRRKITRTSDSPHPLIEQHQLDYYEGRAWANEIAKRGYVVLVPDNFTFGSRRVHYQDVAGFENGILSADHKDDEIESNENIEEYNEWAGKHEHVMAKSLFCGGTTWPGVFLSEDQWALDVLSARKEVDSDRIGCAGLSGGGLRTAYLGGLDPRIKCAVCIGFMSTWNDFLLNKTYTHTWMTYIPILPNYLDFPEIFGLRVPLPTMVQSCNADPLYTLPEMKRADEILQEVFQKAGASERYKGNFYEGGHKFDRAMQQDAFEWFDQWLVEK